MRSSKRLPRRGFTLIELLVAITVLAMVAVLGWRGLDGIVRARVAISEDIDQTRGMQIAYAQLDADCAHIATAAMVPDRTILFAEDGRLLLVRTVFADAQPTRVQVVSYRLSDGQLTRQESEATRDLKILDEMWQGMMAGTYHTPAVTMESGVGAMTMRTWASDNTGWRAADAPLPAKAAGDAVDPFLTGLEVALRLQSRTGSLVKVFLLGSA